MEIPIQPAPNQPDGQKDTLPNDGRPYILIQIQQNGSMSVSGAINELVTALGLLETAKISIVKHIENIQKNRIQPVKGGIINFLRNGKRG